MNYNNVSQTENNENKNEENEETPNQFIFLSRSLRWIIFILIIIVCLCSNFEGGIIASMTKEIQEDINGDKSDVGLLSSGDYIGRILGSLLFLWIISRINCRLILVGTLIFKGFVLCKPLIDKTNYALILSSRILSGFCQVFYTIYPPAWCDRFGQSKWKTLMITFTQLGVPGGIVIGYIIGTLMGNWVYGFLFEALVLVGLAIGLLFMPNLYFSNHLVQIEDTKDEEIKENEEETDKFKNIEESISSLVEGSIKEKPSFFQNLRTIICEKVFLFTTFSYSAVFFGMCILQFWGAEYMGEVFQINETERALIFSALCITATPIGILFGGIIGSKIGGYTKKICIFYCLLFAIISSILGILMGFIPEYNEKNWPYWKYFFYIDSWLYLFFICAMCPLETGIIISSIPESLREDGSSIMNLILNLIGNMPASYIYGIIYDNLGKSHPKSMIITMIYNYLGLASLFVAIMFRIKKKDDDEKQKDTLVKHK